MAEYVCDFVNQRDVLYPHDELPGPIEIFNERRERVIRCRDCKHWRDVAMSDGTHKSLCSGVMAFVDARPDSFCAWAEPREDA